MLSPLAYILILAAVSGYAFWRGHGDEKAAALICVLATVATHLMMLVVGQTFAHVELGLLMVDFMTFAAFTALALRTSRFWPLWVAGFQLTSLVAHALKAIQLELMPEAYAAAARFWVYPIFLAIVVGTFRSGRRRLADEALRT
jgi:hypothetical protein